MVSAAPRFAMVAGEASGDLLAGLLLDGMTARWPALESFGIGGPTLSVVEVWGPNTGRTHTGVVVCVPLGLGQAPVPVKASTRLSWRNTDQPMSPYQPTLRNRSKASVNGPIFRFGSSTTTSPRASLPKKNER